MDPVAVPLITLDDDSDDVTVSANPVIPPNTSLQPILGVKPTPKARVRAGANPGAPPDVPNTGSTTLGVNPNPIVRGPAIRPACRPGYKPRGAMHRHHNLATHSSRGRSNNRCHSSPSSRFQSSLEHPIPCVPLRNVEPEPDIPAADDPDDLSGVGIEEANTVPAPPGDAVALPEQSIAGPVREPACGNNVILPPTEASVASDGVDDTSAPPADPYVALAATILQPPNLPAQQPTKLPAQQSPCPLAQQSPYLPAQQPPYLPAQQQPYFPTQQPPYLPAQQPPYLPAQQSPYHLAQQPPNLPVQQQPYFPTQQPPYHPAQQPPYLPAQQPPYLPAQQSPYHIAQQPPNLPAQQSQYRLAQQSPYLPAQQSQYRLAQQSPYLPAQQPPYLPAQQSPYRLAQQPPNLPVQQPPYLPAQQPPYLPARRMPNLPVQQLPTLPAQEWLNLRAPQPPNIPAQQPLNHPTQQPLNLSAEHKHLRSLTEWFPTVDVDELRELCDASGPDVTFETLVTLLIQSQELPPHDDEAFHGVEDDVERYRDMLDEVASTPERRQQHKHAMYLSEMFPDMSVGYVEKRCAEFDPEESLEVMIEAFLASSDPAAVQSDVSYEEFFDDEGDAAPSILEQCIHHIAVFLPDIDVDEVRERCEDFGPNAAINDIVESLIASHGGTDDDAGAAAAAVEDTEADLEWLDAYQAVLNILPDADPDYLQVRCESIGHDGEAWKRFVADALETKNYPTYEEYAEKQKTVKVQRKYREQFSVRDFVETHPEPVKHFREKVTSQDKSYMPHQKAYLMSRYPSTAEEEIDRVHAIMMFNLYNTCKELSKQEGPVKYPHEYSEYKECYAQVTSQELLEEIAFIENEIQILQYIARNQEQQRREFEKARRNRELMTCDCCSDDALLLSAMTSCEDGHLFCKECVRRSAQVQIGMGKTAFPCLSGCGKNISWKALKEVLKPAVFNRVRQRQQLEEVQAANIRELEVCPFCDFGAILLESEIVFTCLNPECMIISCRLCKERNHIPLHCDELPEKDEQVKLRTYIEGRMTDALLRECWQCHKKFIKVDGCNKMTCTCGAIMCYLCRQPVKDYSHFNGQGADEPNLCPLWSKNEEIHDIAVQNEALKAKKEIEEKNPNVVLKHDPTVVLP